MRLKLQQTNQCHCLRWTQSCLYVAAWLVSWYATGVGYWFSLAFSKDNSMIACAGILLMMGGFLNGVDPRYRTLSPFMKRVTGELSAFVIFPTRCCLWGERVVLDLQSFTSSNQVVFLKTTLDTSNAALDLIYQTSLLNLTWFSEHVMQIAHLSDCYARSDAEAHLNRFIAFDSKSTKTLRPDQQCRTSRLIHTTWISLLHSETQGSFNIETNIE